jgi:hypothetical protein
MAWKFNFSITGMSHITAHKFLVDYLRGGEGRSRAQRVVGGVSEAHGRGHRRSGRQRALGEAFGVEGEAVEVTACSGGEAVEGVLHRRRRAPGIDGVKDLKHASDKNLLSVDSLSCVAHFFMRVTHYFYMRDVCLVRHITLLFLMRNMWVPNGRRALIRHITL